MTAINISTILIILLLTAAGVVIIRKNKILRDTVRSLYEQNKQVLKAEQREREKRGGRKLSNDVKTSLHDTVQDIMENNAEIYTAGFSLTRLSELCDSRPEYVSQVINETFGCSFTDLLNQYRVREACRRIADKTKYGQFTLAAIASSVGIESPTTFGKYFKRVTGLTPSQYKRSAERDK